MGKCPGHDGDRAGEPREVRRPQARDWRRGAPRGMWDRAARGGPPFDVQCPAGFPEGLLAARHVDPRAPARNPYAYQLSAGRWFSTADTAAAGRVGHPARCPWPRHRPRRPRPGWASPHPRRSRGWSIWIGAAISTRMTDVRAPAQLSALASLQTIAVPSLIAFNAIHATLALALGLAAALLFLDGLGWRIVVAMFDRERLITGTPVIRGRGPGPRRPSGEERAISAHSVVTTDIGFPRRSPRPIRRSVVSSRSSCVTHRDSGSTRWPDF